MNLYHVVRQIWSVWASRYVYTSVICSAAQGSRLSRILVPHSHRSQHLFWWSNHFPSLDGALHCHHRNQTGIQIRSYQEIISTDQIVLTTNGCCGACYSPIAGACSRQERFIKRRDLSCKQCLDIKTSTLAAAPCTGTSLITTPHSIVRNIAWFPPRLSHSLSTRVYQK